MKKIIYILVLTIILFGCEKASENVTQSSSTQTGKGGSLARFIISGNFLYVADDFTLKTFNIETPQNAILVNTANIGFGVETIFPFENKLFIGSRDGMFIYSIATPNQPTLLGSARHLRSCDPVVANDSIAFVTLLGTQRCGPAVDGLYTYNVRNVLTPILINQKAMPTPVGLGLSGPILYVCQKNAGLSIFNVSNPNSPSLVRQLSGFTFEDVITDNNLLICFVSTGLVLYDISNKTNPVQLSVINN